ncbi:MAG: hypothetical protein JW818_02490, partial [Pirellulales bacterium]|nr:hypothetical protein [Pirellulales bacterium]
YSQLAEAVFSVLVDPGRFRHVELDELDDAETNVKSEAIDDDPSVPEFMKTIPRATSLPSGTSLPANSLGIPIEAPPRRPEPETATAPEPDHQFDLETPTEEPVNDQQAEYQNDRPDVAPPTIGAKEPFRPMLQVDSFAWPAICQVRHPAGEAALDQLAAGLVGLQGNRRTVVAVAGSSRGAGCTTLLLSAARRLAKRRLNMALVDADRAVPELAGRLGLLPELGWEQFATGRVPLAEVLIESIEDGLSLLPLCRMEGGESAASLNVGLAATVLRHHYDLVLLDLGVPDPATNPISPEMGNWLDAVVLVHDIRSGSLGRLLHARNRLTEAGVHVIGIVENFASGEARRHVA